jgi:GDP-4-dehydro-6-deoxy-D-mannose reductase
MRVAVTGAGGFIGWHLVDALARRSDAVQAWVRDPDRIDWECDVDVARVDITDRNAVSYHLTQFAPELVIHLAAQSLPARSWEDPALTYEINVVGAIHLLETVRAMRRSPRVLIAGSSSEYADAVDEEAITEETPTIPNSPYGASKLSINHLIELYLRRYALDLVRFRPFFVTGPRKIGDVYSDFARRIVAIEQGAETVLRVGSLDVVRDIMDIRDGVSGIIHIAEAGSSGELYNLATGRGVRIGAVLDIYRRLTGAPLVVMVDPALMRPLEQKVRIGDSRKLRALGWEPKCKLEDTLRSILDYWRNAASGRECSTIANQLGSTQVTSI